MGKWTRRAFVTTGVLAGGAVVFGVAIRRGNPVSGVADVMEGEDETLLNIWLKIAADNTVTVILPHAEMGQGVHTTLTMMLADELDADWQSVVTVEAPAREEYANYALARGFISGEADFPSFLIDTVNGFFLQATKYMGLQVTGGSTSVQYTGELAMRVAGAAARAVLTQVAAESWGVPATELRTEFSYVIHDSSGKRASYAELAPGAAGLKQSPTPLLKSPDQFTLMGTSVPRIDIPAKVDGSAMFGIDASLPGMKYATIKASPVFGAKVLSFDASTVDDAAGTRKVVGLDNAVAVVADGYWAAKKAIDRIVVEFSETGDEARSQDDIYQQFGAALDAASVDNGNDTDYEHGDTKAAFVDANLVVDAEYRVPYLAHATMEPMNCTAWVHDGQCELWLGTQNPLGFAMEVAEEIGFDPENVVVHNQYLGGGFGRRAFSDYAKQAARIAIDVDYPVKLIWSREEDMRHDHYRQASVSRFSAALDESGKPTAWKNQYVNKHDPEDATRIPYSIANQLIQYATSETHVPWGFWRSVDHSLHAFFTESFIDELAVAAGSDPYRYRRQLLADNVRFRNVLDLAAEKSDWERSLPDNFGRGIAIHKSFGTIVALVAEIEIVDGGARAHRVVCAVDAGFAMHPDGMKAQMESGIIYGLTAALYGDISIKDGAVAQSNFHDYQMVRMNNAPAIETHIINSGERIGGAGEPGTPGIAPAMANAIYDATGIRVRELPLKNTDLSRENPASRDVA